MAESTFAAQVATERAREGLPLFLILGLPLGYLAAILFGRLMGDAFYDAWFYGEIGLVELSTVVMALAACGVSIASWRRRDRLPQRFLGWWLGLFVLGTFYFGGEEASWGQHLLGWATPEAFMAINDHGETNFHNSFEIADEPLKQLVDMAALIGGIILPLAFYFRGVRFQPSDWKYWFFPTLAVTPACLCAVVLKNIERLREAVGWYPEGVLDMRMSEPQEMYFSMFFLLYALSFYMRLRRQR